MQVNLEFLDASNEKLNTSPERAALRIAKASEYFADLRAGTDPQSWQVPMPLVK